MIAVGRPGRRRVTGDDGRAQGGGEGIVVGRSSGNGISGWVMRRVPGCAPGKEVGGLLSGTPARVGMPRAQLLNMKRRIETLSTIPSNVKFTTVALPP